MIENLKKNLYKFMDKIEKAYKTAIISLMIASTAASNTFAAQPKIVTGTVNLFKAASGWLLLIIPVGAGLFVGFHALQKSLTDDQAVIAEKNKLIKNTVIGAIIAETASGLITVILGFYK
jgi:hypothetical protein